MPKGPRGEKRPADANRLAKLIIDIATGEEPNERPEKNEAAIALGRKGGKARAARLTEAERTAIARKAATTRWKKSRAVQDKKEHS